MASFELRCINCDGHIRALSRAIQMASRITREALLEFTPNKMRLCARTEHILIKFVFKKDFFSDYTCDRRQKCFIDMKALYSPFASKISAYDKDGGGLKSQITIKCIVEDEYNKQLVFKVGGVPPSVGLTHRVRINDLDPDRMAQLNAINRTIEYARVVMGPKPNKQDRFLHSAFASFAPDIDQVTIRVSQSEVRFIGSISPLSKAQNNRETISEFSHKRDDFHTFTVKEDLNITLKLKCLKSYLAFVETTKMQTFPQYIFEGVGQPAHFTYETNFYKGHLVSSTSSEYMPELDQDPVLPIAMGPDESFFADENVIHNDIGEIYIDDEGNETESYAEDKSDSDFLDGDLEGLDDNNTSNNINNSIVGGESIRSRMGGEENVIDRDIFAWDKDPNEIEGVEINYSSSDSDDYL